jgi:hypothetical protein
MNWTKRLGILLAGAAAGVAFVLACQDDAKVDASPADCSQWQYATGHDDEFPIAGEQPTGNGTDTLKIFDVPAGWEPYSFDGINGLLHFRRCKP